MYNNLPTYTYIKHGTALWMIAYPIKLNLNVELCMYMYDSYDLVASSLHSMKP